MKILVTGAAGFIGFYTSKQLLERGDTVVGLDNFNDYYDVSLKEARALILDDFDNFKMVRANLQDRDAMEELFKEEGFEKVVHLAAQAGVRSDRSVPERLSIVGFDDVPRAATWDPPLTTIRQPLVDKGRVAADLLLRQIVNGGRGRIELPIELVVRGSTAPPPA